MDQSYNIFIFKIDPFYTVTDSAWKCFRCSLVFKDEEHARIHREISRHAVTKVRTIVA